jgi:hypothetical protein
MPGFASSPTQFCFNNPVLAFEKDFSIKERKMALTCNSNPLHMYE